jgi:uncharacterized protein YbaR (Trm112 family)
MLNPKFVGMLRCLENRAASLEIADAELLASVNQAIEARQLKNRAGQTLEKPLEGCLVRQDKALAYPIVDGIPRMIVDEAFGLESLAK